MKYDADTWHIFYQTTGKVGEDCNVVECGYKKCIALHTFGPTVRDVYVLHFVIRGKGRFKKHKRPEETFELHAGQCFLICPSEYTSYTADEEEPWDYYWVAFSGTEVRKYIELCSINQENPIFDFEIDGPIQEYIHMLVTGRSVGPQANYFKVGCLYMILSEFITAADNVRKPNVLARAVAFIEQNLLNELTVQDVAAHCFVNRSQLFRVFKDHMQMSPKDYIDTMRLNKAAEFLRSSNYSVTYISQILSFPTPSQFGKQFRQKFGCNPMEYRRIHRDVLMI